MNGESKIDMRYIWVAKETGSYYESQEVQLKYNWLFSNSGGRTYISGLNKEPYRHSLGVL